MIELNIIYNENCLDTMARIPTDYLDLTVTSPPYDDLRDYNGYEFEYEPIIEALYRVTKPGGVVVWIVGDKTEDGSETLTSAKQALCFQATGFNVHDTMIYKKNGASYPSQTRYYNIFEYMFIFSKGSPKTVNLLKDRKNKWNGSWGKRSRRAKNGELKKAETINSDEYGVRFNIWKYNTGKGFSTPDEMAYKHPAIFPERLAADHIYSWSNEGDIVYDPFMGSGTTAKMAVQYNRKFIGSEISEEYCAIAEKRIEPLLRQESLF